MDIIKTVTSISVKTMTIIACAMPMLAPANTDCYGDFQIDREAKTEAEIEAEFFDNMQSAITLSTDCSLDQPQNPPEPESAQNNSQQGQQGQQGQPAGQSGQQGSAGQQSGQPGESAQQGGSADQQSQQAQQQDQSAQQGQPGEAGEQQAQNQQPDGDSAAGRQSGQPSANKPGNGGETSATNPTTAAIPAANIRGTLPLPPSAQPGQPTKVAEVTTQNSRPPPGTDTPPPLSSGAGNRPVKPGNNNDIIAQQILRDAEAETDPELKAKLMAEYERMRGK